MKFDRALLSRAAVYIDTYVNSGEEEFESVDALAEGVQRMMPVNSPDRTMHPEYFAFALAFEEQYGVKISEAADPTSALEESMTRFYTDLTMVRTLPSDRLEELRDLCIKLSKNVRALVPGLERSPPESRHPYRKD